MKLSNKIRHFVIIYIVHFLIFKVILSSIISYLFIKLELINLLKTNIISSF